MLSPPMAADLQQLSSRFPKTQLIEGTDVRMPMTWGSLQPVILLPRGFRNWPLATLRVILTHEYCHVKRRDYLWQRLSQLALAIYWFHPLAWYLSLRMRLEREKACDEEVVVSGIPVLSYAEELVKFAAAIKGRASLALPIARKYKLSARIHALLHLEQAPKPKQQNHLLMSSLNGFSIAIVLGLAVLYPVAETADILSLPPANLAGRIRAGAGQVVGQTTADSQENTPKPAPTADRSGTSSSQVVALLPPEQLVQVQNTSPSLSEKWLTNSRAVEAIPTLPFAPNLEEDLHPISAKSPIERLQAAIPRLPGKVWGAQEPSKTTNGWIGYPGRGKIFSSQFSALREVHQLESFQFHLKYSFNQWTELRLEIIALAEEGDYPLHPPGGIPLRINEEKGWHRVDLESLGIQTDQAVEVRLTILESKALKEGGGLFFSYAKRSPRTTNESLPNLAWHFTTLK
ncbi:MAG: M56 family metallopeptidase [Bacteroidota bacterium]